ncbi:MAG: hypothetical protein OEY44_00520 [Candidatus Peregrinibacteria bacterium]|nr:hypothetical protein [Candidatus Peregrinibacteria bacterium]
MSHPNKKVECQPLPDALKAAYEDGRVSTYGRLDAATSVALILSAVEQRPGTICIAKQDRKLLRSILNRSGANSSLLEDLSPGDNGRTPSPLMQAIGSLNRNCNRCSSDCPHRVEVSTAQLKKAGISRRQAKRLPLAQIWGQDESKKIASA